MSKVVQHMINAAHEAVDIANKAKLAELRHAMEHIVYCDDTVLCPDCKRLAKSSLKGEHWVHFVDDEGEEEVA